MVGVPEKTPVLPLNVMLPLAGNCPGPIENVRLSPSASEKLPEISSWNCDASTAF